MKINTVAIIPARGGSKGIKDKNLSLIQNRPLIEYVLKECKECNLIDLIVVSTDSDQIASVVKEFDDSVMVIKRPSEIAGDDATSETAISHVLDELQLQGLAIKNVIFVQATSPLTQSDDLQRMLLSLDTADSVFFYTNDYGFFLHQDDLGTPRLPRQMRKPRIREAGNAWAFSAEGFKKNRNRLFGKIKKVEIDQIKSFEIDEPSDLILMDCLLYAKKRINT